MTEYTSAQILAAISAALKDEDFVAVTSLMKMLAVRDPGAAEILLAVIESRGAA